MKKSELKKWKQQNRRRPCCRLHSEACRHCCQCCRHCCRPQSSADISPPRVTTRTPPPWPTSSLKYGNAEPSEFHSSTPHSQPGWLSGRAAKWGGQYIYNPHWGGHWPGKFIDPTPILGENWLECSLEKLGGRSCGWGCYTSNISTPGHLYIWIHIVDKYIIVSNIL